MVRIVFVLLILFSGCTLLVEPERSEKYNPQKILDETISLIKNNYPFISLKRINIDSLYSFYSSNISSYNDDEIYTLLYKVLYGLKDGHVWLYTSSDKELHPYIPLRGIRDRFSFSLDLVKNYLNGNFSSTEEEKFVYGTLNQKIGYIYIKTFSGDNGQWYKTFPRIIDELKNSIGIIIDLRSNEGGSMLVADYILSYFIDGPFLSPPWLDARGNEMQRFNILPASDHYSNPVIILQNGISFSAAEGFICMMRELDNVITLGDTTGGGGGSPKKFELSYKIKINLPVIALLTYQRNFIEWNGIEPDILVQQTSNDLENRKDIQLEKAISILELEK